jgi:hypothetical protein
LRDNAKKKVIVSLMPLYAAEIRLKNYSEESIKTEKKNVRTKIKKEISLMRLLPS